MAVNFSDFAGGESITLGDELNNKLNALKNGVNAAYQFRGAWDDEYSYDANDGATYGGQLWISLQDGNLNQTPAEGAYWTLGAAKGDTGAQGEQGPQGDAGPQGAPGDATAYMPADPTDWASTAPTTIAAALDRIAAALATELGAPIP